MFSHSYDTIQGIHSYTVTRVYVRNVRLAVLSPAHILVQQTQQKQYNQLAVVAISISSVSLHG